MMGYYWLPRDRLFLDPEKLTSDQYDISTTAGKPLVITDPKSVVKEKKYLEDCYNVLNIVKCWKRTMKMLSLLVWRGLVYLTGMMIFSTDLI